MLFKNKRAIILGAGASMREGLWDKPISEMPLWSAIKNECTFGTNSIFEFFTPTILTFLDYYLHFANKEKLDKLSLIITRTYANKKKRPVGDNLIYVPLSNQYYGQNSFEKTVKKTKKGYKNVHAGIYSSQLTGIFTITLAIALGFTEIYLLGFDFGKTDGRTHFYQQDDLRTQKIGVTYKDSGKKRSGIGTNRKGVFRTSCYNSDPKTWFSVYEKELARIKIYNVSPESKIETFPKIDYATFYQHLRNDSEPILQIKTRRLIKEYIEDKLS